MSWKELPYWLKGGIIGGGIPLIWGILDDISRRINPPNPQQMGVMGVGLGWLLLAFMGALFLGFIGWIIDKIKSRKQN